MDSIFPKTAEYLKTINIEQADKLDIVAKELMSDEVKYERASQALRRRFSRGAESVNAIDRYSRNTKITRQYQGGKYKYFVQGADSKWNEPNERIWVVAMYALWQISK